MGLFLGSNIKGVYCGATEVKEAYAGAVKVFGKSAGNVVRIGEHDYPYIQINNKLWLTKYLIEDIGKHYIYSESTIDTYGFYYPFNVVGNKTNGQPSEALKSILPDGWRLVYQFDMNEIISLAGGAKGLISKLDGGDDTLGLGLRFAGVFYQGTMYYMNQWSANYAGTGSLSYYTGEEYCVIDNSFNYFSLSPGNCVPYRLVKDL